jgi:hypothetical protein
MFAVIKTFVTDISASTGRNDFIFDIWLCMVNCTVSPLSRFTAHLLPVYHVTNDLYGFIMICAELDVSD